MRPSILVVIGKKSKAPSDLDGFSIIQTLQLGEDLLVSLHEIGKLVDQPRTLNARNVFTPGFAEGIPCGCNGNVDILLRSWNMRCEGFP